MKKSEQLEHKDEILKFLEGEPLPCGYLEPINPYVDPPVCNFNLGALLDYAEKQGKRCWDLTKEEVAQFRTDI